MKNIGQQQLDLPARAPIMVLPGALLFPHGLLPLYIFEPRYRKMLDWSLQQDRMFCIAPMKPGVSEARTPDDFHHVVGIGLIRACVGRDDGHSNLILQGLARVRIVSFLQDKPFRIAELQELPTKPAPAEAKGQLASKLLKASDKLLAADETLPAQLKQEIEQIKDPAVLADVIAQACLPDAEDRQAVFEELDVVKRVTLVLGLLRGRGGPK